MKAAQILPGNKVVCCLSHMQMPLYGDDTVWLMHNGKIVKYIKQSLLEAEFRKIGITLPRFRDRKFDLDNFLPALGNEIDQFASFLTQKAGLDIDCASIINRVSF